MENEQIKKKPNLALIWVLVIIIILGGVVVYYLLQDEMNPPTPIQPSNESVATAVITESNCLAEDCLEVSGLEYPVGDLSDAAKVALEKAIDDEYKARATYEAVIIEIGSVRPFSMIIRAEEQHISSLKAIYDKYGAAIPNDLYDVATLIVPETRQESCQVGVEAEIANAALYRDELLPVVTEYEDITEVFTNLMEASESKHLPAFENCN